MAYRPETTIVFIILLGGLSVLRPQKYWQSNTDRYAKTVIWAGLMLFLFICALVSLGVY